MRQNKIMIFVYMLIISSCSTEKNISFFDIEDAAFDSDYAGKYGIKEPSPSSIPELYFGGGEVLAAMLDLIEKAEDYIVIDTFLIVNDRHGKIILDRLIKKQKEGVRVYVIADSLSNFLDNESGIEYLRKQNIQCTEFNPIKMFGLLDPANLFYRDHSKYWIVDGRYLLIGGCNIIDTSLKSMNEYGNTDIMVLINSPGVIKQLLETFIINWNSYSSYFIRMDDFFIADDYKTETDVILFNQDNPENNPVIEFMISRLVKSAENEIWLIQPYTFIDKKILSYLRYLNKKNIKINVILSGSVNHEKYHYASFYGIKDLLEAGVNVWIYEKESPLHCKAFIVDNKIFSVGSANFNKRSLELSNEVNLIFYDEKSFSILNKCLLEIKKHLRKVSPEEALKYRTGKYRFWHRIMKYGG